MLSALLMFRRVLAAFRLAVREEGFLPVFGAGLLLRGPWHAHVQPDPGLEPGDLVLQDGWLKLFAIAYRLIGIGILVEILRRLGMAFVEVRRQQPPPAPRSS